MGKEKEAVAQHPPVGTARTRARAVEQRPPDATSEEQDLTDPDTCSLAPPRVMLSFLIASLLILHAVGLVNQALSRY